MVWIRQKNKDMDTTLKMMTMTSALLFLIMNLLSVVDATVDVECSAGDVLDTRALVCRPCGLCCQKHEQMQGCLDQGFDAAHACFFDASCADSAAVGPATPPTPEGTNWTMIIAVGTSCAFALVLVLVLVGVLVRLWRKKRRERQGGNLEETRPIVNGEDNGGCDDGTVEDQPSLSEPPEEPPTPKQVTPKPTPQNPSLPGLLVDPSLAATGSMHGIGRPRGSNNPTEHDEEADPIQPRDPDDTPVKEVWTPNGDGATGGATGGATALSTSASASNNPPLSFDPDAPESIEPPFSYDPDAPVVDLTMNLDESGSGDESGGP